jgi:fatty acid synthase subunit beta
MSEMMITNSLVKVKDAPPYVPELEVPVLMNSMARATLDVKTGSYKFTNKLTTKPEADVSNAPTVAEMAGILANTGSSAIGVGVDQGNSCLI